MPATQPASKAIIFADCQQCEVLSSRFTGYDYGIVVKGGKNNRFIRNDFTHDREDEPSKAKAKTLPLVVGVGQFAYKAFFKSFFGNGYAAVEHIIRSRYPGE